jgi:signal transduction histidine kinase
MRASVRTRIVVAMLLVVCVALAVSTLTVREVLRSALTNRLNQELAQEVGKFRAFAHSSGARDVDVLISDYLRTKSPDRNETLFSAVAGAPAHRVAQPPPARLDRDRAFMAQAVAARAPELGWFDSSAGRVRYAVVPVRVAGDPREGHLVVVEFYDREARDIDTTMWVLILVGIGTVALTGLVGWLVAGRALAPLRQLRRTAERVSGDQLGARTEVRGSDDLAQVAATFNLMLDRLQRTFDRQRQFLDDAGHELRTPITVIRGHLELMGAGEQERRETLAVVDDELGRMMRMVQDLLLLAKADQPGFVVGGPVELADLTVEVIGKARALGQRRWQADALAEATVLADRQRLTQALLQLAANAVAHTHIDDVIGIGSAIEGDLVRMWVRDTGSGLPPGGRERLFERFTRGEDRTHGSGAGLGLAIVVSIARAHGGTVEVADTPGGGATFTVDLPLRAVPVSPDPAPAGRVTGGELA